MATKWWITVAGEVMQVDSFWTFAHEAPQLLGLNADDLHFAFKEVLKSREKRSNRVLALIDKILSSGCIMIDMDGERVISFWLESESMYDRLLRWIMKSSIESSVEFTLREVSSMRGWRMTAGAMCSGHQYSNDPSRGGKCPRCGTQVSWDEVLHQGLCPKCGRGIS